MSTDFLTLLGIAAVFTGVFVAGFVRRPPDPVARLKDRFRALVRLSRVEAEAELIDRLEAVAQRHPGHTYEWYLEWLVTDLERAKR